MLLCIECIAKGYCRKRTSRLVTFEEISNPEFVRDARAALSKCNIAPAEWRDRLYDLYRDYPGRIVDAVGEEVFLDLEELEFDEFRGWISEICRPVPAQVKPRIRREARLRFQVVASIVRAVVPDEAQMWGVRGANDNDPPEPCDA